jgi:hypothetical protein
MKGKNSLFALLTCTTCATLLLRAPVLIAQTPQPSPTQSTIAQITQRLDSTTASAVLQIIDSARARGLPTDPLIARALEGASRHIPGPRIVSVVRVYSQALFDSRKALGTHTKTDELVAGADVLLAGVRPKSLTEMRAARGSQPLTVPLVVLADLASRGVPPVDAAAAVLEMIESDAVDTEFFELQRNVASDITRGATPASALALRVQGITKNAPRSTKRGPKTPGQSKPPISQQLYLPQADVRGHEPSPIIEFGTLFGIQAHTWSHRLSQRKSSHSYIIQPSVSVGTWVRYGKVVGALSLEQGVDIVNRSRGAMGGGSDTLGSGIPGDTLPVSGGIDTLQRARPITDLTASLRWEFGRLETQIFAGARFGNSQPARARTGGNLAYRLSNGLAVTARFEHLPDREIALSRGNHFALGLRLLQMPRLGRRTSKANESPIRKFVVTSDANGTTTIRVHAPDAQSVEIMGDVTGWITLPLVAMESGWWYTKLTINSGVHHLNIRADSHPWGPPPGVPVIQNQYEGVVGVIIIP